MNNTKPKNQDKYNVEASSVNDLDGCAAVEATGLIPALPESDAQIDAYKEIFPYSPDCYVQETAGKEKEKTC